MGIGMIADFVASRRDVTRYLIQTADVVAAHEERGLDVVLRQQFEQRRGGFAGAVVESERQRGSFSIAVP